MQINSKGLDLIKEFEGCKLTAYRDSAGILTIGYGCTQGVHEGQEITLEQADKMLLDALGSAERGVSSLVRVPLSPNQFSALVAFTYNVGVGNLKQSTLLNCVNKLQWECAAKEFLRWTKAAGKELPGLVRRRSAESALFSEE